MEDGLILESNSTILLDDCPPWTREKMELATNFTFWAEGIIQVMKKKLFMCYGHYFSCKSFCNETDCSCVMDIIDLLVIKVFVRKIYAYR